MKRASKVLGLWLIACVVAAQGLAQDTKLYSCLPDSNVCIETDGFPVGNPFSPCGVFWIHRGLVSWPPLRAVGSITVEIETYDGALNVLPLYVEIKGRVDSTGCKPPGSGEVILDTRSRQQCGGVWESVGPLDIRQFTPIGSFYRIQVFSLVANPPGVGIHSPGVRCLRVTVDPATVATESWGRVKMLYRRADRGE